MPSSASSRSSIRRTLAGFSPNTLLLLLLLLQSAPARTAGRVVRVAGRDTLAVAGAEVVLHKVGSAAQGPIDTVRADARGSFSFRFRVDTAAAYLLSVRHDGIEYFSAPVAGNPARPDTAVVIIVADTSSSAPVGARERTLLVSAPDETGSRTVVDWIVLQNSGERTRVAHGPLPAWGAALPPDAQNVGLADAKLSQFSAEAVEFRGDSVLLFAPLSPGQKELILQYHIPGSLRRFEIPMPAGIDSVFVLLEEPRARVAAPGFSASAAEQLSGRSFRRFSGRLGGASSLEVRFAAPAVSSRLLLLLLVSLMALGFIILARVTLGRRSPARVLPHPLYLADAIARLDLEQDVAGPEERERLRAERERLAAELERALAGTRRRS